MSHDGDTNLILMEALDELIKMSLFLDANYEGSKECENRNFQDLISNKEQSQ